MVEFFKSHLDFVFLMHGLAFFVLSGLAFLLSRTHDNRPRWIWLALFGLVHAINEWLDMFALTFGDNDAFVFFRIIILTISFIFLFEFGRSTLYHLNGILIRLWVYSVFAILLYLSWAFGGNPGLNMAARYLLGFLGGFFVAVFFFIASFTDKSRLKALRFIEGLFLELYAFSQLFITPSIFSFHPFLTTDGFLETFGFPVQLLRCAIAISAAFFLWVYWYAVQSQAEYFTVSKREIKKGYVVFIAFLLIVCTTLAWFVVELVSDYGIDYEMGRLYSRINTAAAAVNPRRIETLTASLNDIGNPDYERLREQLIAIRKSNKDARFVYLMSFDGKDVVILVDSEPVDSPAYSPPGQIYSEAPNPIKQQFLKAEDASSFILQNVKDRWGQWCSAFAPIKDFQTKKLVAILGIDTKASLWQRLIFQHRLLGIVIVLGFFLILIGLFIFIQINRASKFRIMDSERLLDILLNSIPTPVYYKNTQGQYLGCNVSFEHFVGRLKKDIIGKTVFDLMPAELAKRMSELDEALFKKLGYQTFESSVQDATGALKDVVFYKATFTDDKMKTVGLIGVFMDITDRRRAEQALKEKEDQFRAIYEGTNDAVMIISEEEFIDCNSQAVKMFGFNNKEEFLGRTPADISPPFQPDGSDSVSLSKERMHDAFKKGVLRFEWLHKRKDGEAFFAEVLLSAFHYSGRKVLQAAVHDITKRKEMENALIKSEERYRLLAENATDIIWTMDSFGKYTYISPAVEKHLGYTPDEASKMAFGQALTPNSAIVASEALSQLFSKIRSGEHPGSENIELEYFHKDGSTVWCDATYSPIYDSSGKFVSLMGVTRNISDHKKVEEVLRLLAAIVESSDDAIISKNLEGILLSWNKGAEKMYGYTPEEIIGKSLLTLIPDDHQDEMKKILDLIRSGSNLEHYETKHKRKNGVIFDVSLTISPLKDKDGHILGASTIARDITESKRLQDLIFSEKERLSVTLSSIGDGVIATDTESKIVLMNKAAESLTGWTQGEAEGRYSVDVFRIINEETRQVCNNPFEEVVRSGKIIELGNHTVLIRKNGEERVITDSAAPIHDRQGSIIGAVLVFRDITEQKKMLDDLRNATKEWQRTFDSISDILFIQDKDMNIIKANQACLEAVKLPLDQVIGKKCYEVVHRIAQPWPGCPGAKTSVEHIPCTEEVNDPNIGIPFLVTVSPIFDSKGEFIGAVHIARDISDRKKVEDALRKAVEMKTEFTSTVSHELRTPLAAIKEGISIVLDGSSGNVNKQQKEFLDIAKRNVDRLNRLINDILDFEKLESGKMVFNMQENDINDAVNEVRRTMQSVIEKKGLDFKAELDKKLPKVKFDKDRIIQVLTNLVNNAVKFTEKGNIKIVTEQGNNIIKVSVKDTGIGIKEEDLSRLFEKYEQLNTGVTRKTGGTGLGLSICKDIMEKHGGKIWVESKFGEGSAFCFVLPIKEQRGRA